MPAPPFIDILLGDCLSLALVALTILLDEWRNITHSLLLNVLKAASPFVRAGRRLARLTDLLRFAFKTWARDLYQGFHPPQHPFIIWRLHPIPPASDIKQEQPHATPPHPTPAAHVSSQNRAPLRLWQDEFRLVPDRMAHYDMLYALLFAATAASMDSYWIAGLCIVALWLAIPIALHIFVITPEVYETLDASVATPLQDWFENIPSKTITYTATNLNRKNSLLTIVKKNLKLIVNMTLHRFEIILIPRVCLRDPVYTQAASSPQGAFLALALANHFAPDPAGSNILSRGFLRFFLTYCTPVWTAYIALILMALYFQNTPPQMTALAFAWAALALWFLLNCVIRYGNWLDAVSSPLTALRTLPYAPLWRALPWPPPELHIVRDRWVRLALAGITATGLALILAALQVLPEKPKAKEEIQVCVQCIPRPKKHTTPDAIILNTAR